MGMWHAMGENGRLQGYHGTSAGDCIGHLGVDAKVCWERAEQFIKQKFANTQVGRNAPCSPSLVHGAPARLLERAKAALSPQRSLPAGEDRREKRLQARVQAIEKHYTCFERVTSKA